MKITNKHGLPAPVADELTKLLIRDRTPPEGKFWVTSLLNPPQAVVIEAAHKDEIEEDVADAIWLLRGLAIDEIVCRNDPEAQRRLEVTVTGSDGKQYIVSGKADRLYTDHDRDELVIDDYKDTSVWAALDAKKGNKVDWKLQLNLYRWMYWKETGKVASILRNCLFIRDWRKSEARRQPDLPQVPFAIVRQPVMELEEVERIVVEMVDRHVAARNGVVPACSSEDMWEKPKVFAVKKAGGKRAVPGGLCETEGAAASLIERLKAEKPKDRFEVEERPGERTRCADYCNAANWCPQFAAYKATQKTEEEDAA